MASQNDHNVLNRNLTSVSNNLSFMTNISGQETDLKNQKVALFLNEHGEKVTMAHTEININLALVVHQNTSTRVQFLICWFTPCDLAILATYRLAKF